MLFGLTRLHFLGFVCFGLTIPCARGDVFHYQRIKSFGSDTNDGRKPWTTLVQGSDGVLYGTTAEGGSNSVGTVFKLNVDGSGYQVLHHFGEQTADGLGPIGSLTAASDGRLYGTTTGGGTHGAGTIFKLERDGSGYTVLRNFFYFTEGNDSESGLLEGSDGALYGTTGRGPGDSFGGTLFAVNKDGTGFRLLHRFGPYTSEDGLTPDASVIEGSDGALYGTTSVGGGSLVGSVFKINKDATGYQKLHAFGFDGVFNPFANLLEGSDHALYGTCGGGAGGVFKLHKDGTGYQVLHGFNGDWSFAALVKGREGALYSTTSKGGGGLGTVFRINEDGSGYEVVHSFGLAPNDGQNPQSALVLGKDGAFYGTTLSGGEFGHGTVFRLLVNRVPVVQCADVLVFANGACLANASVDVGSFDPDGDLITLVQTPLGPYATGTNRVTLTVTDSNGDSNECTAAVIVLETTPPSITCPTNMTVEFISDAGAQVSYTVSSADICDLNPEVTSVPPSGSMFPIGSTMVHSTATDASGNRASCQFKVTVLGARGVKQDVLSELVALRATALREYKRHATDPRYKEDVSQLDEAIRHLRASLNPGWWIDQTHLHGRQGQWVFNEEAATVGKLCFLLHRPQNDLPQALLEGFISRLNRADHLLASVAIQEALGAGAPRRRIDLALTLLARGDTDALEHPCNDAIIDYSLAWELTR